MYVWVLNQYILNKYQNVIIVFQLSMRTARVEPHKLCEKILGTNYESVELGWFMCFI